MKFKVGEVVVITKGGHEGEVGIVENMNTHSGRNRGTVMVKVKYYWQSVIVGKKSGYYTLPKYEQDIRHATKEEIAEVAIDAL